MSNKPPFEIWIATICLIISGIVLLIMETKYTQIVKEVDRAEKKCERITKINDYYYKLLSQDILEVEISDGTTMYVPTDKILKDLR